MKNQYIKSPMNYIGNKYRIIGQIMEYFPQNIRTFADIFAGGLDVSINIQAGRVLCNDINYFVIDIYREFQRMRADDVLAYIDQKIAAYGLSKENKEGYLKFREDYNRSERYPLDLFILMCYSFNHQIRFNSNHEYNNPFGARRSSFNGTMRKNLIRMLERIRTFEFYSKDFTALDYSAFYPGDFVYADPPYSISTGSYNDGKRGFKGWSDGDDRALFDILDSLDRRGVAFALSNVVVHKGLKNEALNQWMQKYHVHDIRFNYNNSNYQFTGKQEVTREVLITNY